MNVEAWDANSDSEVNEAAEPLISIAGLYWQGSDLHCGFLPVKKS